MEINKNSPVTIFAGFNVARYSHWLEGLRRVFNSSQIHYSVAEFPKFDHHALPVIIGSKPGIKIYISAGDGPGFKLNALEWCDLYAKWTLLKEQILPEYCYKIVPLGPRFDIRVFGPLSSAFHAMQTYLIGRKSIVDIGRHFKTYFQQYYFRSTEEQYFPGDVIPNYVFYASTLYPNFPMYNSARAVFIEACQSVLDSQFEGGLIRKDSFRVPEYSHITITKYYSPAEWLAKTKSSLLGFWAPGDQGAMTLKLAEFMACGKAIVAMPIRQEQLPSPLVHGEHVHFVDGSLKEMKAAVRLLTTDHVYRQKLERNARQYYEKWITPAQAVRRLIREGCLRAGVVCGQL